MAESLHEMWREISAEADGLVKNGKFTATEIAALLGAVRSGSVDTLPGVTRQALRWAVQTRQSSEFLNMALRGLATLDFDASGNMSVILTDLGRRLRDTIPPPPNNTQH